MPTRPTMGGFQAPQWLMETIRNLEQSIRRLEESINSIRRGETVSVRKTIADKPADTVADNTAPKNVELSNKVQVCVNNTSGVPLGKTLNFISGQNIALQSVYNPLTKKTNISIANTGSSIDVQSNYISAATGVKTINMTSGNGVGVDVSQTGTRADVYVYGNDPHKTWDATQWGETEIISDYVALTNIVWYWGVQTGDEVYLYEYLISVTSPDTNWDLWLYIDDQSGGFTGANYIWDGHVPIGQNENGVSGAVHITGLSNNKTMSISIKGLSKPLTAGEQYLYIKSSHESIVNCAVITARKGTIL